MIPTFVQSRPKLCKALGWVALLSIAFGLRLGLAIHFPNLFHPDEIFQTLEPAHRLAYGYGIVTWEWMDGVRSWVFPAFLAGIMRATGWMGPGSSAYILATTVILSLISLSTIWFGYAWAKRASGVPAAIIAAGACSIYFGLVYFAPKTLNEVVATHLLLPGLYLGVYAQWTSERKRLFLAGVLCGLAAMLRIQLIPAIAFAAVYFCYPHWRRRIPAVFAGLSIPILIFGLVDKITWSYPWQSCIRYFQVNLIAGHGVGSEHMPWYWYGRVLLILIGPAVLFLWHGARRSPFLAFVALAVVATHSLIAHKEPRYIFTVLPLALTLASIGVVDVASILKARSICVLSPKTTVALGLIFFSLSSISLAFMCSKWYRTNGGIAAMDRLSQDSALCGVGIYQFPWWHSGGFSHLHRNVPMLPISDAAELLRDAPSYNALIAPLSNSSIPPGFKTTECWNGVCLLQRDGPCTQPPPRDEIQAVLQAEDDNQK